MSCDLKDISKMYSVLYTNIQYDVTDLVNRGMVENIKI